MDTLPLHPMVVHLPIALAVLMPVLSGGLLLAWSRGWLPKRAWLLTVAAQALLLGSGLLAMQTGEADEDRVERIVPDRAIEAHEEAAEVFTWAGGGVLVLVLLPFVLGNGRPARAVALAGVAGTAVVLFLGYRVGEAGGELVYRHGAADAFSTTGGAELPAVGRVHDSDDDR